MDKSTKTLAQNGVSLWQTPEHKMTLESNLYRMRTGCPWRYRKASDVGILYLNALIFGQKGDFVTII